MHELILYLIQIFYLFTDPTAATSILNGNGVDAGMNRVELGRHLLFIATLRPLPPSHHFVSPRHQRFIVALDVCAQVRGESPHLPEAS
jgi:hypothetical protein